MIRKGICIVFIGILLAGLGISASAADGSIRVTTEAEQVVLYQVGREEGSGYRLTESYGGGYLTFDDTLSAELAAWLSGRAENGVVRTTEQGSALFSQLEEGLYLVCSQDSAAFAPFLVTIPWDGYFWELDVEPEDSGVPQTGDPIGVFLFTLTISSTGLVLLGRWRKNY